MMPIVCNWKGGGDEAIHKVKVLNEAFDKVESKQLNEEESQYFKRMREKNSEITGRNICPKKMYLSWINAMWNNKGRKAFFDNNYLYDFISQDSDKIGVKIREDIPLFDYDNKDEKHEKAKNWLILNTKLIIQRSYRIINQFSGDWNYPAKNEHEENLKKIMGYVFEEAGFSKEEVESETFLKPF